MSKFDHNALASRQEQSLLDRTLGGSVPEFTARFGAEAAIKRVEAELRRAKRARSRKLYAFWSAVRARIEFEAREAPASTNEVVRRGAETFRPPPAGVS